MRPARFDRGLEAGRRRPRFQVAAARLRGAGRLAGTGAAGATPSSICRRTSASPSARRNSSNATATCGNWRDARCITNHSRSIGFAGNELVARVRLRGGQRLGSAALVADGNHARVDGFVSLGVVASAIVVALGAPIGDPLIGIAITVVILKVTWDSWQTISRS